MQAAKSGVFNRLCTWGLVGSKDIQCLTSQRRTLVRTGCAKIFPSDLSCLRTFVEFQVLTLELGCPGDCLDDA